MTAPTRELDGPPSPPKPDQSLRMEGGNSVSRTAGGRPSRAEAEAFIAEFLSAQLPVRRWIYHRRFKRFARFQKLSPLRAKEAVARLLTLRPATAISILDRHARWLKRVRMVGRDNEYGGGGFPVLTKWARRRGLIAWQYRGLVAGRSTVRRPVLHQRLEALIRDWEEHLANSNYRPSTIRQKAGGVRNLGAFLAAARVDFRRVPANLLERWKKKGLRSLCPSTVGNRVNAVSSFYRWLEHIAVLRNSPARDLERPKKQPKAEIEILTEQEVRGLLGAASHSRDRALFELFYATGCRRGEMIGLNVDDVSLKMRRLKCVGKGGKGRLVFFGRSAARAIRAYLPWRKKVLAAHRKQKDPAFFVSNQGTRIHGSTIERALKKTVRQTVLAKRTYPHLLRHSFATHILNRGAGTEAVQALLGHKHPSTTATYTKVGFRMLRRAYEAAHPWMR